MSLFVLIMSAALAAMSVSCQEASSLPKLLDFCPVPCGLPLVTLGGTEYYIHTASKVTWFEAYEICRVNGLRLLSIESEAENNLIRRGMARIEYSAPFWTSGNDIESEGTWIWRSTGQPVTFTDWEVNQPEILENGLEHCMFVGNWGRSRFPKWHDATCTEKYNFICEKPK